MASLTDAEKEVVSAFTFCQAVDHDWRDVQTLESLSERSEASKWCIKAVHAENLNFEAVESLQEKKMIYWYAGGENGDAYYHLTPKGFKAARKAGIINA